MQILHNWHIIYLTGKPIDRCRLSTPAKNQSKITVNFSQELDGYFLCLKLLTSVTIAHIIITNVNKSEYVTIGIIPLSQARSRCNRSPASPLSILYCHNVQHHHEPMPMSKQIHYSSVLQQLLNPPTPSTVQAPLTRVPPAIPYHGSSRPVTRSRSGGRWIQCYFLQGSPTKRSQQYLPSIFQMLKKYDSNTML